ncbi:uncharacterized protein BDZ99DRAFT_480735 [Mytilinidion resinicola]|uniref:Uncharacterized protein n=1 Tax=Mytilinidion resinicola TaxID=574789 RepID=A0A6A6Y9Q8_9PEZI|nr:uncharacterized protein BDZ99DRAFT_480735 [Mytilinidion resinicola]KAF2805359.1 hypothetical protein BDZ99DRAFT_480735 [Mytilinidion resinicola]
MDQDHVPLGIRLPTLTSLTSLFLLIICPTIAINQVPLSPPSNPPHIPTSLNFSSPGPYLFHSLATLLQQWPQTFFPNGHTIASVTIPPHTLLYHGRHDASPPPSPEWLAFDVEMAYGIMGNLPDSRLLTYRTTRPVRAVYFDGMSASLMGDGTKSQMVFLYNGTDGIPKREWPRPGRPPGRGGKNDGDRHWNPLEDEYFRARGLCAWLKEEGLGGRGWGYEGVVRMNAGFEAIWCDFESPSLRLVSNLNVSVPRLELEESESGRLSDQEEAVELGELRRRSRVKKLEDGDEGPHGPGMADPIEPFKEFSSWMWFSAATRRYFGEPRVKVDVCGLFSFYDPGMQGQTTSRIIQEAEELNITTGGLWIQPEEESDRLMGLQKLTRRRRAHELDNVSNDDGLIMRNSVNAILKKVLGNGKSCSGIEWHSIAQEIVKTYHVVLQDLQLALQKAGNRDADLNTRARLESVRFLTHWLLLQFLEYPPNRPYSKHALANMFSLDSQVARHAFERCRSQYAVDGFELNDREDVLSSGINDTLSGICSTFIRIGMEVEYVWLAHYNNGPRGDDPRGSRVIGFADRITQWKHQLEELIAWLGWAEQDSTCRDVCAPGEMCYIPMWPVAGFPRRDRPPPERPDFNADLNEANARPRPPPGWGNMDEYLWHPTCVNASSFPP